MSNKTWITLCDSHKWSPGMTMEEKVRIESGSWQCWHMCAQCSACVKQTLTSLSVFLIDTTTEYSKNYSWFSSRTATLIELHLPLLATYPHCSEFVCYWPWFWIFFIALFTVVFFFFEVRINMGLSIFLLNVLDSDVKMWDFNISTNVKKLQITMWSLGHFLLSTFCKVIAALAQLQQRCCRWQ